MEYGWNYEKFHPYSTHNSTIGKSLIIKAITTSRWKGGISNKKKYFSEKRAEKVLTSVKNIYFYKVSRQILLACGLIGCSEL